MASIPQTFGIDAFGDQFLDASDDVGLVILVGDTEPRIRAGKYAGAYGVAVNEAVNGGREEELGLELVATVAEEGLEAGFQVAH